MRVDLMTREYPPKVYGGAGVHVTELAQVLRSRLEVRVHCFEGPRTPGSEGADPGVTGYDYLSGLEDSNAAIRTLGVDLAIVKDAQGADLVHSHTWYANMADVRHPPRRLGTLLRALASLEGRTAGWGLPHFFLGRENRLRRCGRNRGGFTGDA